MKHLSKLAIIITLSSIGIATGLTTVYANENGNDALAINNAKIDIQHAIAAAESSTGGKTIRAEFENENEHEHDKAVYDIEVVKGNKVFDIRVDGETGQVIQSKIDDID